MKQFEKYAFFLDIDGTLYADGEICDKNRETIKSAMEKGHLIFINTARSMYNMPDCAKELDIDGFITALGTCIVCNGRKIRSIRMKPTELAEIFEIINSKGLSIAFEGEEMMIGNIYERNDMVHISSGAEILEKYSDTPIAKAYLAGVIPIEAQKFLSERYNFFQHAHYAEFAPKGFSKADGIDFVCEHYGIDKAHCVAMGDSANDIDMMKHAGISIAMGNATDEVKAMCDIVTCDAKYGGVAEGILKIVG